LSIPQDGKRGGGFGSHWHRFSAAPDRLPGSTVPLPLPVWHPQSHLNVV